MGNDVISVTPSTKEQMMRVKSEMMKESGKKVSYGDVIRRAMKIAKMWKKPKAED